MKRWLEVLAFGLAASAGTAAGQAVLTRVSVDSTGAEADADSGLYDFASFSGDGRYVGFASDASNLVAGDTNGTTDCFVHDRVTGATVRVSVASDGSEANGDGSYSTGLSQDGRIVVFTSGSDNLVANDTNDASDVFVHDRDPDGNGVFDDGNASCDVFVRDLTIAEPEASWSNYGAGFAGTLGVPTLTASADPVLGTTIDVDVGNSLGSATLGVVLAGFAEASIPTSKGGTLLVDQLFLVLGLPLAADGIALAAEIPADPAYCGLEVFAQVLELDDGALKGLSFTAGLELVLGM